MIIKTYFENGGKWDIACDITQPHKVMSVDISFEKDGLFDETEFSIRCFDVEELDELFADFCEENQITPDKITNITVVEVAASMEELVEKEEQER